MKKAIYFICKGNICRSVMAKNIFEHIYIKHNIDNVVFDSYGVTNWHVGDRPDYRTEEVLHKNNISCDLMGAKQLSEGNLSENKNAILYCMDSHVLDICKTDFPSHAEKFQLLDNRDFEDPYYKSFAEFEILFRELFSIASNLTKVT